MARAAKRKPDWYIDHIVGLMCRGVWIRGRSRRSLAEEWGLPVSTVANYATQASKIVKSGTDEELREEVKVTSIERLGIIAAKAEQASRFAEAVKAISVMGEMAGVLGSGGPTVEVTVNVAGHKVPSSQAAELGAKAYAFFDQELERRLRARCPDEPQLAAEVLAWFLEYVGAQPAVGVVDVPALPAGGG